MIEMSIFGEDLNFVIIINNFLNLFIELNVNLIPHLIQDDAKTPIISDKEFLVSELCERVLLIKIVENRQVGTLECKKLVEAVPKSKFFDRSLRNFLP